MKGQIPAENALDYILAGNAKVTLVSKSTGQRFTYKVATPKGKTSPHFVRLLTGPDNRHNYSYMGRIVPGGQYIHDKRNRAGAEDSPSTKGFRWVLYRLVGRDFATVDANVEIWHEGKCGRCGRTLTVPESIATGIGPVCSGKAQPTTRNTNVIRHPKALQSKSHDHEIVQGHKYNDGTMAVDVKSANSGNVYRVMVADGAAQSCECEWGGFRPGADKRTACSHAMAAIRWLEQTGGRTPSFWPEDDADAVNRQHRPARNIGDNVVVTSRKQDTDAAWAAAAAASRKRRTKESWQESQREAAMMIEVAKAEIEQDQAAEMAKMEMEESMVSRLMNRAG